MTTQDSVGELQVLIQFLSVSFLVTYLQASVYIRTMRCKYTGTKAKNEMRNFVSKEQETSSMV